MERLVDIFYYDYILCKIIDMYNKDKPAPELSFYCKIANTLQMEYANADVKLDSEIYVKTVLIKLLQLSETPSDDHRPQINAIMLYLRFTMDENNFSITPLLKRLITVVSICYAYCFTKDEGFNMDNVNFVVSHNGTFAYKALLNREDMGPEFSWNGIFDYCKTFKFGQPVLFKFVKEIKDEIDLNNTDDLATKKVKINPLTESPGQKLSWD
ncbi:hypothetical protein PAEPH01_0060 [Pancytospora epiphaga]|nr:hypothetical protein PAEPH01_0060 [Pancytospora epiphaga]